MYYNKVEMRGRSVIEATEMKHRYVLTYINYYVYTY